MDAARPDVIVNGAAFTDVDGAEDHPIDALNINAFGVRALRARPRRSSAPALVHYSTDFVFDGRVSQPYTEEDRPNPRSVYAASKLLGEWFALGRAARATCCASETLFGRAPGGGPPKGSVAGIVDDAAGRRRADRVRGSDDFADLRDRRGAGDATR